MEGEESLQKYSPEVMVQDPITKNAVSLLPHIVLFHGTDDYSIPSDSRFESHLVIRYCIIPIVVLWIFEYLITWKGNEQEIGKYARFILPFQI